MKKLQLVALTLLLSFSSFSMASGHKHSFMKMMKHANPAPNLMRVIKKQGEQLNLSEEQEKELAAWRKANSKVVHAMVKQIVELEKKIGNAVINGQSKAEIMGMAEKLMAKRSELLSTKVSCRDNLQKVLTSEQYQKLISIYKKM